MLLFSYDTYATHSSPAQSCALSLSQVTSAYVEHLALLLGLDIFLIISTKFGRIQLLEVTVQQLEAGGI